VSAERTKLPVYADTGWSSLNGRNAQEAAGAKLQTVVAVHDVIDLELVFGSSDMPRFSFTGPAVRACRSATGWAMSSMRSGQVICNFGECRFEPSPPRPASPPQSAPSAHPATAGDPEVQQSHRRP